MMSMFRPRTVRSWLTAVPQGLYRSVVLVALTGVVPVITLAVAVFASWWTLSWTAHVALLWPVAVLAVIGELALAIWWAVMVFMTLMLLCGRRLSDATRVCARGWLGLNLQPNYRSPGPVVQMASGHWWNGHDYDDSAREARFHAALDARKHDPQLRRDALWLGVSAVTVFPAAALPLLAIACGAWLLTAGVAVAWGASPVAAGIIAAPFCWRLLGPIASRLLSAVPPSSADARIAELESVRADLTKTQASELERIERGLHDGAQARLVALGMSVGAAGRLVDTDPAAAKAILADAQSAAGDALTELRALAHGINPPVLAERGLVDAVRAVALDSALPVTVRADVPARPERPIETAMYFAAVELIANAVKHAHASRVDVELDLRSGMLTAAVRDDGVGGATESGGSGLTGLRRRLAAFDGRLEIDSPIGGPTCVTVAVPCVLS